MPTIMTELAASCTRQITYLKNILNTIQQCSLFKEHPASSSINHILEEIRLRIKRAESRIVDNKFIFGRGYRIRGDWFGVVNMMVKSIDDLYGTLDNVLKDLMEKREEPSAFKERGEAAHRGLWSENKVELSIKAEVAMLSERVERLGEIVEELGKPAGESGEEIEKLEEK